MVVSALQDYVVLKLVVVAYDIMCQYVIHLRVRLDKEFTPEMIGELKSIATAELPEIVAGIGKYHEHGHRRECRPNFSLHYLPGVGMFDGETCERNWGITEPLARRTKEMSPGHRHDILNDHYSDQHVGRVHGMSM